MKKVWGIVIAVLIVALVALGLAWAMKSEDNDTSLIKIETEEDMQNLLAEVYKDLGSIIPDVDNVSIDLSDEYSFSRYTGLKSNENVETVLVSAPLINAQAYEVALIKVKDGANIESMKQEILDNINMNMWICVSAEKLYITNYKNVIFLSMSTDEWATPVYKAFKEYVGSENIGKELEKTQDFGEDFELPPEIFADPSVVVE